MKNLDHIKLEMEETQPQPDQSEATRDLAWGLKSVPIMINASISDNYGRREFVCGADAKGIRDMCYDILTKHAKAIKEAGE